ncbi:enoyl-CoA hydratase-related protein [Sedimentitalea arenosa]|uniref:Enoyl-CoA hydratase/isomerase family protein n=1 Tax=Sedimentitalea arenosa TaxID=2798803 RepID=A0A8J7LW15_9RHOB|nr:enoyl-CoA hydratase-related protein [Arenibacterium arenosum]MBJ6371685.1 enoyl-CoA hydratase/isomerase family protein [Arenibacterium arenosum]
MTTRKLDTGTDHLSCEVSEHVALITLANPAKRNALSEPMTQALRRILDATEQDTDVRVLVLTGAGGALCAGGDVGGMGATLSGGTARPDSEAMIQRLQEAQEAIALRLYEFPKPTIACLPGPAAGAGLSLALACDLRVACDSAMLVPAFAAIGLSGDFGGSWLLSQLIGPARAKEIYFTGRRVPASEALELGLVNRVTPDGSERDDALALAAELAAGAPIALRYMKDNINRAGSMDFRSALRNEADRMIRSMLTEDHRNAAEAFLEKRKPVFRGR